MSRSASFPLLLVGVAAFAIGAAVVWQEFHAPPEPAFAPGADVGATVLPEPSPIAPFALTDHRGQPFTEANLQGKWTFLFFGYTSCPDICPTTLSTLAKVGKLLAGGLAVPAQIVFVSVDPKRDTQEKLAQYVGYFGADVIGVAGADERLEPFTRALGIGYKRHDEGGSDYLVDHTASILLLDPQGRLLALFSPPHDAAAIAADFRKIAGG